jgi:predicted transcriptional regulator
MSKGRNSDVVSVRLPDELVNDIKALARKRGKSVSELLAPAIKRFVMYASARERSHQSARLVASPAIVPGVIKGKVPVVGEGRMVGVMAVSSPAVPGARLTSEVEPLASELASYSSKEKYPGRPGDRYPGTARGDPCPCHSGKKYKRCCGEAAPPKEL